MLIQTASLAAAVAVATLLLPSQAAIRDNATPRLSGTGAAYALPVQTLDDATIVAIFDAANTADIETGKLAAKKGASSEVRSFGAMLVHDHEQVRQMGRDLAKKLGVTPTPPADDAGTRAHAEAMAKLSALSGAEFDRAFLVHEEAFHATVISAINATLMPAIKNAELKALVTKVAPAFEAHRRAAADMIKQFAVRGTR